MAETVSKIEAVRRILRDHGKKTQPQEIKRILKENFNIEMSTAHISNYKTMLLRKKPAKKKAPKAQRVATSQAKRLPINSNVIKDASDAGVTIEDLAALKVLVVRLGKDALSRLIDLLS